MSSTRLPMRREYTPAPTCYGGGFVFPELNDGIPWRTPEEWRVILHTEEVKCDWPNCSQLATQPQPVDQFMPFLCVDHLRWVVEWGPSQRAHARRMIKNHMTDLVLVSSYGSPKRRGIYEPAQLSVP